MAITIIKEPEGIYPAYNDSYVEFSSNLINNEYAEITVYPILTFPNVFLIYPDANDIYVFNLKEAVKVIFNANGFEDSNYFTDSYFKSISDLYLSQNIKIEVFSDITSDSILKTYEFFKAVKQVGELIHSNPFQLLSYSPDGVDHSMTYYEGFPFHFDILQVTSGSDIIVKSLNTGNETLVMNPTTSEAFRVNIDRGGNKNWTLDNILPLIDGLNKLEIYEDGDFKTNLLLTKKKNSSGLYLKWFNRHGGFNHYLFEQFYIEQTKGVEYGRILNNEFNNIYNATGIHKSLGKKASGTLTIKTKYDSADYEYLRDIFESPLIQMYTSKNAYVEGKFIDVSIDGSITFSNKRGKNEINLIVDLPERITVKL